MPLKCLRQSCERFSKDLQSDNKQVQTRKVFTRRFKHLKNNFDDLALVFKGACKGLPKAVKRPSKGLSWLLNIVTTTTCNFVFAIVHALSNESLSAAASYNAAITNTRKHYKRNLKRASRSI